MYLAEPLLFALAVLPSAHASLYSKKSPVLQVDAKSYKSLIAESNHTSIVEFYAPWCGHCKNLAPAYAKAATSLQGLANVAAVNCDEDANKPFCGSMGVQGFPTLKIVKPGKKKGKPVVQDYQGPRSAKGIVEAVKDKIPNHVTSVKDDNLESWLEPANQRPKALFFSDKGLVPALVKALAIDFLGAIDVGYVRNNKKAASKYGVDTFPAVVLVQNGDEPIKYDGEINKLSLTEFLSQAAPPNTGASASASSKPAKKDSKKASKNTKPKTGDKADAGSCPHAAGQGATSNPHLKEDDAEPLESPIPDASEGKAKPAPIPVEPAPKLKVLESESALQKACLSSRSSTCVLAIVPEGSEATELPLRTNLAETAHKHVQRGAKIFPFYEVADTNEGAQTLLKSLKLPIGKDKQPHVLAVNAKRGWYSAYTGDVLQRNDLEKWIDDLRLGDMKKETLPESVIKQVAKEAEKEDEKVVEEILDEEVEGVEHSEL
ncbi:hypothetical protein FH972_025866 [Carpinus fangiana]|uniref:protein disulfide-isomerase n=1 Tax=Carpinus fangiana TaxID=176857 RepID=A0A5N6L293_9ROSI|nr:hypothetical protein FH972_025866 [Carpinus fangiana]